MIIPNKKLQIILLFYYSPFSLPPLTLRNYGFLFFIPIYTKLYITNRIYGYHLLTILSDFYLVTIFLKFTTIVLLLLWMEVQFKMSILQAYFKIFFTFIIVIGVLCSVHMMPGLNINSDMDVCNGFDCILNKSPSLCWSCAQKMAVANLAHQIKSNLWLYRKV